MKSIKSPIIASLVLVGLCGILLVAKTRVLGADEPKVQAGLQLPASQPGTVPVNLSEPAVRALPAHVGTFFSEYCVKCHGPEKSKGKVTLHDIGNLGDGRNLELWSEIHDVLDSGEMPPEEKTQPSKAERDAMLKWIAEGRRAGSAASLAHEPTVGTRRMTNFEYQNTMRDLLGFELNLLEDLPEDPVKPYHFNNTTEFMLLGPEQIQAYLNCARSAMAGAIVDPGEPKVHKHQWTFEPRGPAFTSSPGDEVGVYGSGMGTASRGVAFGGWPETGEYRIRIRAAAILPPGHTEVPLRLVMGSALKSDSGTGIYTPVGMVNLSNDADHLEEFEFRGRIENHPIHVGLVDDNGNVPKSRFIYPQNLYDNGKLNDYKENHFQTQYQLSLPRAIVRTIEFEAPVTDVWPPEHHKRILFDSSLGKEDSEYIRQVIERFASRAFRRPVTSPEIEKFTRMYDMLRPDSESVEAALRETLAMVLIAPQFLYHTTAASKVVSQGHELASRLSYFLWGSMPDAELISLAEQGRLDRPEVIEAQVRRLLGDERSGDFVRNFTLQWLSTEKSRAVAINQKLFPRFLHTSPNGERQGTEALFVPTVRDLMLDETVGFVAELIRRNASVFNVVDSDFAFLNERLAAHYGVEGVRGMEMRPVPIKPEHRLGGLLTQGSVLIGNGTGTAPHPIYRAVWLREAILGDKVAPPPADIPDLSQTAGESVADAVSIKDLLRIHRTKASCKDCHARLDPWGIPFEEYNAVGKYQPKVTQPGQHITRFSTARHKDMQGYKEYLDSIYTVDVDAKSRLPSGEEVNGMRELKDYLLESRKRNIADNVITRLFTYGIGREMDARDHQAIEAVYEKTAGTNHGFQDLIIAVCTSDTFRKSISNPKNQAHE
jgi:mono/diheme cytochrome c family protein